MSAPVLSAAVFAACFCVCFSDQVFERGTLANVSSHSDHECDGSSHYQGFFKLLNIGIANTLRSIKHSKVYYLTPNMYLVKNDLPGDSNQEPEAPEVKNVVSLFELLRTTNSLFESHSLFCLLTDKTGLQISRTTDNEDLGIRIKKIDEQLENHLQSGRGSRGKHDLAFLPIMYAMGVIMTMLGVITFLTIKSITIGVVLLVVAYTYTLSKLKHHKKFYYHYPEQIHHQYHQPHVHHHKGYAIDVLQHDILHDYEQEFPYSPHSVEAAYHVDIPYHDLHSSASEDHRKQYSQPQAGWAYVVVDKLPEKMNRYNQKRGVITKKKRKVSNILNKKLNGR